MQPTFSQGGGSQRVMARCWPALYGVQRAEEMHCGRLSAELYGRRCLSIQCCKCQSREGLAKGAAQLPAVLSGCNKLWESPVHPQRMGKALISSAGLDFGTVRCFTAAPGRMEENGGAVKLRSAWCDQSILHLHSPGSSLMAWRYN